MRRKPTYHQYWEKLGIQPELIRETEWERIYRVGKGRLGESKFLDGTLQVSFEGFVEKWHQMDQAERIAFAQAYSVKPKFTVDDAKVLDYLMEHGGGTVWNAIAQFLLKHPDRDKIIDFLVEAVGKVEEPANLVQALGLSKDKRAVPALMPLFEAYAKAVDAEKAIGIPDDVFFGPIPYSRYLGTCWALMMTAGSSKYEQELRRFLDHPHPQVRRWAAMHLDLPTEPLDLKKEFGLE